MVCLYNITSNHMLLKLMRACWIELRIAEMHKQIKLLGNSLTASMCKNFLFWFRVVIVLYRLNKEKGKDGIKKSLQSAEYIRKNLLVVSLVARWFHHSRLWKRQRWQWLRVTTFPSTWFFSLQSNLFPEMISKRWFLIKHIEKIRYIYIYIYIYIRQRCKWLNTIQIYKLINSYFFKLPDIGIMVRVFANGPEDLGSITGRVIPKTQKNGTWCYFA